MSGVLISWSLYRNPEIMCKSRIAENILAATITFVILLLSQSGCLCEEIADFRVISYEELLPLTFHYGKHGVIEYSQLTVDIPRGQLLVGARDFLFRLSLTQMEELEAVEWSSSQDSIELCKQKGQQELDCRNFIRVLLINHNTVFTCGTNAFSPKCSLREIEKLNHVKEWTTGVAKCPFSPHHNSTSLITSEGHYYSATVMDFTGRDPAIYREIGHSKFLRTRQYDSKWLSEPSFIAALDIANFTYFFFRENAVEVMNCGKNVYSRVARICKNDVGGYYYMQDRFTTFIKARLNCSIPGEYPFYYDELQSIYYIEQEQILYGVFTTPPNSILGSAICAFNMSAINTVFGGPFKQQDTVRSIWEKHSNPNPTFQCETGANKLTRRRLTDVDKFQLMDSAVQPTQMRPLHTEDAQRYTHIVAQVVPIKRHEKVTTLFVATLDGLIKKYAILPRTGETCLVGLLHIFPSNETHAILNMKLVAEHESLYVGTTFDVIKVPLHNCHRFPNKVSCMNAMDPHCGWNSEKHECSSPPSDNPNLHIWHQNISSCPITDVPVDGHFGPWSEWFACPQTGEGSFGETCMCRSRNCSNPTPQHGGLPCKGPVLEVSQCIVNGGWTEWSSWSSCSQTCGSSAVQTRIRTCGNPAPQNGGRVCIGWDKEEKQCENNPKCPVDGQWSEWSGWSECTSPCNGGFQKRRRLCDNPTPSYGGRSCVGNSEEYRECNVGMCPEMRKSTGWTPWQKGNFSKNGYTEQRYKFACRAYVPDAQFIKIGNMRTEERFCLDDGKSCLNTAFLNIDGDWTEWSSWSECSAECGGGVQYRERTCSSPKPTGSGDDCEGYGKVERECNTHSCQGMWSCWTDFSPCSVSCGHGVRIRTRTCLSHGGRTSGAICIGPDSNEEKCEMAFCQFSPGWEEWTLWSVCTEDNKQFRKRNCRIVNPTKEECQGTAQESKMCFFNELDINALGSTSSTHGGYKLIHVIIGCIVAFIVGVTLTIAILIYIHRRKRLSSPSIPPNKPNFYTSDPDWQNNYGTLNTLSKGKPNIKEATIKRNTMIRTNLQACDF